MSFIEIIAVAFSIIYVILAAKENIWCWLFGAVGSAIFVYISFVAKYYYSSLLQLFYFLMAFYGYWNWNKVKVNTPFIKWSLKFNSLLIFTGIVVSIIFGFLLDNFSGIINYLDKSPAPYLDSFATIFSLFATLMVTKKVLENWLYWIIINITNSYLYFISDNKIIAGLFVFYTIISVFGYFSWKKQLNTLS